MTASEQYVEMPEAFGRRKLNELYRAIPLKDTTSRLLRKYFSAMASLYGIITLETYPKHTTVVKSCHYF